jgi:cytochrome c biogenesis protein CcmG, thiol:disulfide interchange protein DsbE
VNRGRVRLGALLALCVLLCLVVFLSTRSIQQGATEVDSPLLGTVAPTVVATTLSGGHVALDALRGRVVVLSFFASWCPPCKQEAPNLAAFAWHEHESHSSTELLGVVFDDEYVAAASFVHTYGLTYPILEDSSGVLANEFAVTAPPVTVVLTPSLRIDAILEGPVTTPQLETLVAQAARAS